MSRMNCPSRKLGVSTLPVVPIIPSGAVQAKPHGMSRPERLQRWAWACPCTLLPSQSPLMGFQRFKDLKIITGFVYSMYTDPDKLSFLSLSYI